MISIKKQRPRREDRESERVRRGRTDRNSCRFRGAVQLHPHSIVDSVEAGAAVEAVTTLVARFHETE